MGCWDWRPACVWLRVGCWVGCLGCLVLWQLDGVAPESGQVVVAPRVPLPVLSGPQQQVLVPCLVSQGPLAGYCWCFGNSYMPGHWFSAVESAEGAQVHGGAQANVLVGGRLRLGGDHLGAYVLRAGYWVPFHMSR